MAQYYPGLITTVGSQISQFMPGYPFPWSPNPYFHNPLHSIGTQGDSICSSHSDCDKYNLEKQKKPSFHMKGSCNNFYGANKNSIKSSTSTHASCDSCYFYDNISKKTKKEVLIDCNTKVPQGLPCFNHPITKHKDKELNCNKNKNTQFKKNSPGINKSPPKCSCGLPLQVFLQPYPIIFPVCCSCCQVCTHNTTKEQKSEVNGIPPVFPPYSPENNESSTFTKLKKNHSRKHFSTSNCSIQTDTPRYCIDIQGNMNEYLSENLKTDSYNHNNLFVKQSNNCHESLKRHTSITECIYHPSETLTYPNSKNEAKENNCIRKSGSSHSSVRSSMSLELPPNHSRSLFFKDYYELSNVFQSDKNILLQETCEKEKGKQFSEETRFNFGRTINISSEALDKFAMELLSDKFEISKTSVSNKAEIPTPKGISGGSNVTNFKSECSMIPHKVTSLKKYDKGDENTLIGDNNNVLQKDILNQNTCSKIKLENFELNECLTDTLHHTDVFQSKGNPIYSARSSVCDESLLDGSGFNCLKSDAYFSSSSSSLTDTETNMADAKTDHIHAVQNIIKQIEQDHFSEIYESIMNPLGTKQPSKMCENRNGLVLNLEPNLLKDCEVKNNDEEIELNSKKMQPVRY